MPFGFVPRRYRHLRRYRQIAEVLLRHGFGYAVEQLDLHHLVPFRRRLVPPPDSGRTRGARLRAAVEELGTTFIKLGQLLSTRPDVVPQDIRQELARLQDRVPPVPTERVVAQLEQELGRPVGEVFASFDPEPLAAASIGQVHRALLPGGSQVAVKVRRPEIEGMVETDLEILEGLAALAEERFGRERFSPKELVDEFARALRREMDFRLEAANIERFRRIFADEPRVRLPKVYWEWTTSGVLVSEFFDGVKITDREGLERIGADPKNLARLGAEVFLRQVLIEGVFHGDPHPGNFFVLPDGRLGVVDFGIVGRLEEDDMNAIADMMIGVTRRDPNRVVNGLIRLGAVARGADWRDLRRDLADLIDRHYGQPLGRMELGSIVHEVLQVTHRHRIRMPSDLFLLGKALVAIEGLGRQLDPEFNAVELAEPFVRDLIRRRLDPASMARRAAKEASSYLEMLARLPEKADETLTRLLEGNVHIHFIHEGLERTVRRLELMGNRMAAAVVLGALILGSAIVLQADAGPRLFGVPALGLVGFVLAGVVGLGLIIGILRSGRF
ncbi:MAG: AarF/ABC1/UbiB kinase family protein [Firmicutes bacterium]|nr:AarF/ABC1/UbiB kinase family protein [Bacillota bacterium]